MGFVLDLEEVGGVYWGFFVELGFFAEDGGGVVVVGVGEVL